MPDSDDDLYEVLHLTRYIELCMRAAFVRAHRVLVRCDVTFNDDTETWTVTTDYDVFTCEVGSDDDYFTFTNRDDTSTIQFPYPADSCPNCHLDYDAMTPDQRAMHTWDGEICIVPCRHT